MVVLTNQVCLNMFSKLCYSGKLLLAAFVFCLPLALPAQEMRKLFIDMPDQLMPLQTKIDREDFVDFLESNMRAQVKNKFDYPAELKVLTPDYLLMQTTAISTLQMKLLQRTEGSPVVCMVKTVNGPVADSSIRFFTTGWEELLAADYIQLPAVDDFLLPVVNEEDKEKRRLAKQKIDMSFFRIELQPTDSRMNIYCTSIHNLNKEDSTALQPFFKAEPIVYQWSGSQFVAGQ